MSDEKNSSGSLDNSLQVALKRISMLEAEMQSLQAQTNRYSTILDTSMQGIWILDLKGNTTYVNSQITQMLGFTKEEMQGRSLFSFLDEQEAVKARSLLDRRLAGIAEIHEFQFQKKDCNICLAIVSANPIFDSQGQMVELVGMLTDITYRKTTEAQLQQANDLLRKAEEIAHVGSWEWDIRQDTWRFSEEWRRIHGFGEQPLSINELLPHVFKDDLALVTKAFDDALAGIRHYNLEHRIINQKTGQVRWLHAIGEVHFDEERRPLAMTGVAKDITSRKRSSRLF